jgi:hypothetical protein
MTTTVIVIPTLAESAPKLSEGYCELRWYAAYTTANHEKRVSEQLGASRAEHFCRCTLACDDGRTAE